MAKKILAGGLYNLSSWTSTVRARFVVYEDCTWGIETCLDHLEEPFYQGGDTFEWEDAERIIKVPVVPVEGSYRDLRIRQILEFDQC